MFILNLALVDFLFCFVCLAIFGTHYVGNGWPFPQETCMYTALFRSCCCMLDWFSLVLITLSRYIFLKPCGQKLKNLLAGSWASMMPVAGAWLAATAALLALMGSKVSMCVRWWMNL